MTDFKSDPKGHRDQELLFALAQFKKDNFAEVFRALRRAERYDRLIEAQPGPGTEANG